MKCLSKPKLNWARFVLLSLCLFIRSGSTHFWSPLPGTEGVGGNSMDQTHHLGQAGVLERGRLPAWYLTNGPSVSYPRDSCTCVSIAMLCAAATEPAYKSPTLVPAGLVDKGFCWRKCHGYLITLLLFSLCFSRKVACKQGILASLSIK